jgi:hypothetical protein
MEFRGLMELIGPIGSICGIQDVREAEMGDEQWIETLGASLPKHPERKSS